MLDLFSGNTFAVAFVIVLSASFILYFYIFRHYAIYKSKNQDSRKSLTRNLSISLVIAFFGVASLYQIVLSKRTFTLPVLIKIEDTSPFVNTNLGTITIYYNNAPHSMKIDNHQRAFFPNIPYSLLDNTFAVGLQSNKFKLKYPQKKYNFTKDIVPIEVSIDPNAFLIIGRVYDVENNNPIIDATVILLASSKQFSTDKNGFFRIQAPTGDENYFDIEIKKVATERFIFLLYPVPEMSQVIFWKRSTKRQLIFTFKYGNQT